VSLLRCDDDVDDDDDDDDDDGMCCPQFLEAPYINFAFKVAELDLMAVGAPDLAVADLVAKVRREMMMIM
jgi:hypothetical protein